MKPFLPQLYYLTFDHLHVGFYAKHSRFYNNLPGSDAYIVHRKCHFVLRRTKKGII